MDEDPIPSSEPLDLNTIQRQVRELEAIIESCRQKYASELSPSDSDDLIRNCGLLLQDLEKAKLGADVDYHKCGKDLLDPMNVNADKFEIFPNDVYINDILDAAKSLRKSSLQWFVTKVQDRIVLCTMRRLVVKNANKSRYSLEYLDKDETVVAHVVGGVDAFIKVAQVWPLLSSPLKLIYLKSSDQHSKGISLSFLCKVQDSSSESECLTLFFPLRSALLRDTSSEPECLTWFFSLLRAL
ncbi:PREDICTED: uncharacterized protein LOC103322675 [Prunus mume]|uniref:Uncharacterized protein LOC103322675 n=1 Tax=Prunus mume TaxID=102107 RepID=A0ABM1LKZ7_PRUMU|nr:PREDICTED: uncharacterized protein LOC103322675 [Prunus mume]